MSSLDRKERRIILESLEAQGCEIIRTKKGVRILFPNGDTTAMHTSHSDHRAFANMRADIRRAGLAWPFDGNDKRRKK